MKIIKTTVTAKTRQLSANWKIEKSQDLEYQIGDDLTKILKEEIDRQIIEEITGASLVEQGWSKVPNYVWQHNMNDIQKWLDENITDEYRFLRYFVYFKSSEDASFYVLEWA